MNLLDIEAIKISKILSLRDKKMIEIRNDIEEVVNIEGNSKHVSYLLPWIGGLPGSVKAIVFERGSETFEKLSKQNQPGFSHEHVITALVKDLKRKQNNHPNENRGEAIKKLQEAYLYLFQQRLEENEKK